MGLACFFAQVDLVFKESLNLYGLLIKEHSCDLSGKVCVKGLLNLRVDDVTNELLLLIGIRDAFESSLVVLGQSNDQSSWLLHLGLRLHLGCWMHHRRELLVVGRSHRVLNYLRRICVSSTHVLLLLVMRHLRSTLHVSATSVLHTASVASASSSTSLVSTTVRHTTIILLVFTSHGWWEVGVRLSLLVFPFCPSIMIVKMEWNLLNQSVDELVNFSSFLLLPFLLDLFF